ncbi:bifunctional UDP-sugar hydrolase/5'-nucleotidase [Deinococcus sp. QL22]|uniref:bifunctional metallophosphatase/5'-nucleotidase n=1 Tax=Deinococcus sp. QL22 TaxID=2939437 RepID=UPI002016C42D|nr:5'-nucleotidase C-terminal domain-containing protein [Deinococcus sp. QL22]UQN06489.1 5'-nucleotidase C-terminal domain-containing protein [Deinococcus sp. QL22]
MARLTFLHSNDIHGRLEGLARLTTLARREQAHAEAEGRTVFRWDAGDAFDRRFEDCRLTRGESLAPVLTASGVTLQTLGNDIGLGYGMTAVTRMARRAGYTLLAANLRDQDGAVVEGLRASVLLNGPDGLSIGVFGLTDPFGGIYGVYGLNTPDVHDLARQTVTELRDAGAGLVVLLSHLGLEADHDLAAAVSGIDLIIGGHSHDLLPEGERVGKTLVVQAGEFAEHLGRVDLDVGAAGAILADRVTVLPVPADLEPDAEVMEALAALETELQGIRTEAVGTLAASLHLDHWGESPMAHFAAQVLRERAGAEVGLISGGALHTGLQAGEVRRGAVANAVPATINPMTSRVTGWRLRMALERGLDPEVVTYLHRGLRGSPIGVPGLSGVQVTVDPAGRVGERVQRVQVNGEALDLGREYVVAHTDLEPAPYAFLHGEGVTEIASDFTVLLEDVVRQHFQHRTSVHPDLEPVWLGLRSLPLLGTPQLGGASALEGKNLRGHDQV